ncbi:unknown [Prevotella sp. CAG:617]|nr:unknown [Prevotella sp. CAG:617]
MLVVLNAFFQHFHAVERSRMLVADGGMARAVQAADVGSGAGRIFSLHYFQVGVLLQEFATLHQGYGVGVDFVEGAPVVFGQTHDAVFNVQLVFAHHGHAAHAQQVVVVQQAAGNGVFDGHQTEHRIVVLHVGYHVFKRVAEIHFYFLTLKILVGGDVVE